MERCSVGCWPGRQEWLQVQDLNSQDGIDGCIARHEAGTQDPRLAADGDIVGVVLH
jgi:hypothetical protein